SPPAYPFLHGIAESRRPADLRLHLRGNPYNLGDDVPRRFLEVLSAETLPTYRRGSGRLDLAAAIVQHPLTARVMVNRIWQHHFANGIVRTASNFGKLGERPTHPELLEYLAARFIENRWSIKAMHREIMLSATYRLGGDFSAENFARDPDNLLCWRASRRRLDVEALRDAILFVSGSLDSSVGGASVDLNEDAKRRTVYGKVSRFETSRFLSLFDFPDPSISSEKRNMTNVPLQRLFFMNSELIWGQAGRLAKRLNALRDADDTAKIRGAYHLLYGREATEREILLGREFLRGSRSGVNRKPSAWQQYAQALLGANEFFSVY
ncbi:MAG: DUF1553 domain-containing protein, partial [Gammaproteobacteria bacterium]